MRRQRSLSKMKRVEIVVERRELDALVRLIAAHSTGYTVLPGATGFGKHGVPKDDMAVLVTVVTEHHLEAIVDALLPSLDRTSTIVLVSDVTVLRAEHFIPEVRAARHINA